MLALVLARRDFRENDQIITLYTKEKGKVEALARGIKKIISKNSAALEPYFLIDAEIIQGKDIDHLVKAQVLENFVNIVNSLGKISVLQIVNSFADSILKSNQKDEVIFNLLLNFSRFLNETKKISSAAINSFVLKFLSELGFAPELKRCVVCGKIISNRKLLFSIDSGGVVGEECGSKAAAPVKINQSVLAGLRFFLNGSGGNPVLKTTEAKLIQRLVYKFALYHSEKKIPDWKNVDNFIDE